MNTPVIVEAVRTPQGKEDGVFADIRSEDLSIPLVDEMLARTGLTGEEVDDVVWGCAPPDLASRTWSSSRARSKPYP